MTDAKIRMSSVAATVLLAAVTWGHAAAPASRPSERELTPTQAFHDTYVLMTTLQEIHPNLFFRVTPDQLAEQRAKAEANFTRNISPEAFFAAVEPLVRFVGDKHTRLIPPPSAAAAAAPTGRPDYRWRFEMVDDGVGYIDFVSMDSVGRDEWNRFLEKTFAAMRDQGAKALIVDLRHNGGGDSRLGDDLLKYVTEKPYRPITRKSMRWSHRYLNSGGLDGFVGLLEQMAGAGGATPDEYHRKLLAQNPAVELKALLASKASPALRGYLKEHAPHWLDVAFSPATVSEWLTMEFPAITPTVDPALRFRGPTCFLVGPETFSSAVILANAVKDHQLGTIIGQETPPCNQFGEIYVFTLPHSRLEAWVSSAQFVRANGDASDPHGVLPDISVRPGGSGTAQEGDAVLAEARRWASRQGGASPGR